MFLHEGLTTADLRTLFEEEMAAAGGTVSDTFDDGECLFTRSLLPDVREVQAADSVQGGVALKAMRGEVWVYPYTFRLVCRNGAIRAHALQGRQIETQTFATPEEAAGAVRAVVRDCCDPEAFAAGVREMRSAREAQADFALDLLPLLARLPAQAQPHVLRQIMERFFHEGGGSRYALMNAVTAVARDTRDPVLRWDLEEAGGAVPARRVPRPVPEDSAARALLVG
jgi:hypothetical protein